jgi:hypothetical protein
LIRPSVAQSSSGQRRTRPHGRPQPRAVDLAAVDGELVGERGSKGGREEGVPVWGGPVAARRRCWWWLCGRGRRHPPGGGRGVERKVGEEDKWNDNFTKACARLL